MSSSIPKSHAAERPADSAKDHYLRTPSTPSLPMPVPNHNHQHQLQTSSRGQMLFTPPNSVSPAFHSRGQNQNPNLTPRRADTSHSHADVGSDLDLQDVSDHARAHTQPPSRSPLSVHQTNISSPNSPSQPKTNPRTSDNGHLPLRVSALTALKHNECITPTFLAAHYLQPLVGSGCQFLAFDHLLGYLTTTVPGFSRISPAKARRLVAAALSENENISGDGTASANVTRVGPDGVEKTPLLASVGADNADISVPPVAAAGTPWAKNDQPRNPTTTPKQNVGAAADPAGKENDSILGRVDHFSPPNSFPSPSYLGQSFTPVTPDNLNSELPGTYQDQNPLCHHRRLDSSVAGGSPVFSFFDCDGGVDKGGRSGGHKWKTCDRCDIDDDDGVDEMSLDYEDDRSGRPFCCSPTPEDDEDGGHPVDDEANDLTDEEDWESMGADALLARSCPGQSYMQGDLRDKASPSHHQHRQQQHGIPISPHSINRPPSSFVKSVPTPSHMGAIYTSMDRARQHQSQQHQQLVSGEEERVAVEALLSMGQH